ncbi:hypothetical protein T02_9500 [Trichinella nativa]|uniref:Uncharacterized protein n=1 Tax=Trichinella nativa TaxID=6335 RepID=A0A0V1L3K3_9BILA|nr:hypothetical protein T02_9500 [Trichinella nativa]
MARTTLVNYAIYCAAIHFRHAYVFAISQKICIMYNAHYCVTAYYLGRSISVLSCTATITPPSVIFHNTAVHFFHVTPLYRLLRSTLAIRLYCGSLIQHSESSRNCVIFRSVICTLCATG